MLNIVHFSTFSAEDCGTHPGRLHEAIVQTQAEPAILQIQTLGTSGNHAISNEPVDPCHGTIATDNEIVAFSGGPQAKSILAKARQMQKQFNQTSSSRLPNSNTVVQ